MIRYAQIENNIVVNVIICEDSEIESLPGIYIKITEETNNAQIGYEYISEKNKFKSSQPYPSWVFDENSCKWNPPVAIPEGAEFTQFGTVIGYSWNEESQEWVSLS